MTLNQWPIPNLEIIDSSLSLEHLKAKIEDDFSTLFNKQTLLLPSARSCISIILKVLQFNRSKRVSAPLWSSHCVWDVISRYSNPTYEQESDVDLSLVVHKWGYKHTFSSLSRPIIIEDSVDSLLTSEKALFPNDGDFEVVSLPKVIGSYSGGLLILKNDDYKDEIMSIINSSSTELSTKVDELKKSGVINSEALKYWHALEWENFKLTAQGCKNILKNIPNYYRNLKTCQARFNQLSRLKQVKVIMPTCNHRVACNAILIEDSKDERIPTYHFNSSFDQVKHLYISRRVIPVHSGISDSEFEKILRIISG
ncbi:MAG: putative PLP-dependent aminotransferase [Halobacteriovorax sp.]|nr:putative PLP-dependent aminotransferase [Halobacteriovorax sp.]